MNSVKTIRLALYRYWNFPFPRLPNREIKPCLYTFQNRKAVGKGGKKRLIFLWHLEKSSHIYRECEGRGERENRRNTCFMEWGGVGSFSRFWTIKSALGSRTLSLFPKPLFPWLNEYILAKGQEFPLKPVINHYNCLCFQKWKCP